MPTKPKPSVADVDAILDPPQDHATIHAALVGIARDLPTVEKDANNPHYRSTYATLDAILAAVIPILSRHGCALTHSLEYEGEAAFCVSRIIHAASEASIETRFRLASINDGPQAIGSELTYARRYALGLLLPVATDHDDDANGATPSRPTRTAAPERNGELTEPKPASKAQVGMVMAMFREGGWSDEKRRKAIEKVSNGRTTRVDELTSAEASRVIDRLQELAGGTASPEEVKESLALEVEG